MFTHTHTHTHIHTYIHAYIQTYIHIQRIMAGAPQQSVEINGAIITEKPVGRRPLPKNAGPVCAVQRRHFLQRAGTVLDASVTML